MIYDVNGAVKNIAYTVNGNETEAFDVNGDLVLGRWEEETTIEKLYDEASETFFYLIKIPQTRTDGNKQFPFLYAPNGTGQATQSTLEMNRQAGFKLAINAGIGGTYTVEEGVLPIGCLIENGELLQQGTAQYYILTVDDNGAVSYANPNTDGGALISDGVISAVVGFVPIVVNGAAVDPSVYEIMPHDDQPAQRQIIGQYANGDYAVISCEGRGFDSSVGWDIPQAIAVCLSQGLVFAYNLDGGGSVETVVGDEQLNVIYEGENGRKVQNYIVFNGTDRFFVPGEN